MESPNPGRTFDEYDQGRRAILFGQRTLFVKRRGMRMSVLCKGKVIAPIARWFGADLRQRGIETRLWRLKGGSPILMMISQTKRVRKRRLP
jgi:hypothetical protein